MKKYTQIYDKDLVKFIQSCKFHENKIDALMTQNESVERGKSIAKEMNRFNYDLDLFLHQSIGIEFSQFPKILNKTFKLK